MARLVASPISAEDFERRLSAEPLALMTDLRRHGTVCAVSTSDGDRILVTTEPRVAAVALAHGSRNHRGLLRELLGSGLFVVASGDKWRQRRGLLRPLFTPRAVESMHDLVINTTSEFVDRELRPRAHAEINLADMLQRLSVEIILHLVDPELGGLEFASLAHTLHEAVIYLDKRLFARDTVVGQDAENFTAHLQVLTEFIARRSAAIGCPVSKKGVLAGLAPAVDGSPEEIALVLREEILSIFVAGVETMGTLLTWVFYNLARHEEHEQRCLAEARAADLSALAASAAFPPGALPFTRAVVEESLRLYPPAWALFRRMDNTIEVEGVVLPAGDFVLASTFVIHRDPELWDSPLEFRPGRFLANRPPANQYFPFGAGPHQCLGRQFSILEAQLASATILSSGSIRIDPDYEPALRPAIALAPDPAPTGIFVPRADTRGALSRDANLFIGSAS